MADIQDDEQHFQVKIDPNLLVFGFCYKPFFL